MELERLTHQILSYNKSADTSLVRRAYEFSAHHHREDSFFFMHSVGVAYILAELKLDIGTITAGLLHDLIERKILNREEIELAFGSEIATLVEGVAKISRVADQSSERRRAENLQKMLLAMVEDIRVVLVKLADTLHDMRSLSFYPESERERIAKEASEIYAPLAHRLGMGRMRGELEDLAFLQINPEAYQEVAQLVARTRTMRERYIEQAKEILRKELEGAKIEVSFSGRPKHFYSIYRKMRFQGKSFDEIYDLNAIRVITKSIRDCYAVLGIVHQLWPPLPKRFKDYISKPKGNMYQALHTTVMGPENTPMEVQIKTEEMHKISELGIAAHWRYKEGGRPDKEFDEKLAWLRRLLEWQIQLTDPRDLMESLKVDLFSDQVFVFTPKGEIKELPAGATPVDFAYEVHTEIGERCTGAKVNGKMVSLKYKLRSGDVVEIITSPRAHPSQDWLKFVKTSKARAKIRQYLRKVIKEEKKEEEQTIPQEASRHQVPSLRKTQNLTGKVSIDGLKGMMVRFAKCCNPIPGDEVIGYITQGRGVSIHCKDCPNIQNLNSSPKIMEISWEKGENIPCEVGISAYAYDRVGLLQDMLAAISSTKTIINAASAKATKDGMANCNFTVVVLSLIHI